jgi:Putative prokaryotic signal transducing protein
MLRRLRNLFAVQDPLVSIVAGLSEPEAEMWRELLENNGIPAMVKNRSALGVIYHVPVTPDCDLVVKASDQAAAREVLGQERGLT